MTECLLAFLYIALTVFIRFLVTWITLFVRQQVHCVITIIVWAQGWISSSLLERDAHHLSRRHRGCLLGLGHCFVVEGAENYENSNPLQDAQRMQKYDTRKQYANHLPYGHNC